MRGLLAILAVAASLPAAALSLEDFRDPQDGRFDTSRFLLDLNGFLPLPFIITEPAIGYGGGAALLFFDRNAPPPGAAAREGRFVPPDITAAGGMATENGTRGGFAGHLGFSSDGNWRYVGAVARTSLNLSWFGADFLPGAGSAGRDYNLDADLLVADVRRRIPGTDWMAGLRYVRADTQSRFDLGRPAEVPQRSLDVAIGGLALVAEYDDRDSIFTPGSGKRITAYVHDFAPRWGGDQSFRLYKAAVNAFASPRRDLVLGGRLDWRGSSGNTPFYALPFVELRGIPALRYQGEQAAVAEVEARWNLDGRWSAVGFGGAGRAAGPEEGLGSAKTRWAGGVGIRYFLARAMGLHVGVDVARGPEEGAFYIVMGSAWR
ncbi:MAG: glyceraldehyde-3-phosphate dehydrogenase [Burkholderiales bacterium]|nr:glyceraldehyde-3-phosphate dehydrogenase [Burkholderiales bacterium]